MYFSEAYVCNIGRTQELSRRMNKRMYPSSKLSVCVDPTCSNKKGINANIGC